MMLNKCAVIYWFYLTILHRGP